MSSRESQAEKIFLDAVERHEPDQWPAFVKEACSGEPDVRNRVEALLAAHHQSHRLIEDGGVLAAADGLSIGSSKVDSE